MAKKKSEDEGVEFTCPLYTLFKELCGRRGCPSEFLDHLRNARVELLMAVRSLIDKRIEDLRAKPKPSGARKIKVTEKA